MSIDVKDRLSSIIKKSLEALGIEREYIDKLLSCEYRNIYVINIDDDTLHIRFYFREKGSGKPKLKTVKMIRVKNRKDKTAIINYVNKVKGIYEAYKYYFCI